MPVFTWQKKIYNTNNVQFLFCEKILTLDRDTKEYKKQCRNIFNIEKIAQVYFIFKGERKYRFFSCKNAFLPGDIYVSLCEKRIIIIHILEDYVFTEYLNIF